MGSLFYNVTTLFCVLKMHPNQHQPMPHQMSQQQQHSVPQQQQQQPPVSGNHPPVNDQNNSQQGQRCIRHGCTNPAIVNSDWEDEYCSNECVITHCRWVKNIHERMMRFLKILKCLFVVGTCLVIGYKQIIPNSRPTRLSSNLTPHPLPLPHIHPHIPTVYEFYFPRYSKIQTCALREERRKKCKEFFFLISYGEYENNDGNSCWEKKVSKMKILKTFFFFTSSRKWIEQKIPKLYLLIWFSYDFFSQETHRNKKT